VATAKRLGHGEYGRVLKYVWRKVSPHAHKLTILHAYNIFSLLNVTIQSQIGRAPLHNEACQHDGQVEDKDRPSEWRRLYPASVEGFGPATVGKSGGTSRKALVVR
jgi:hypothetical protein